MVTKLIKMITKMTQKMSKCMTTKHHEKNDEDDKTYNEDDEERD